MNIELARYAKYRWVVLGTASITAMALGWAMMLTPSLAYTLFPDLGLNHTQFTLLFTAPTLVGIFATIPGGALGDRYGIRLIVGIGSALAGVSALCRAFVPSFAELFALTCIFGAGFGITLPNLPKLVGIWFPPHQVGFATGLYSAALAGGSGIGLATAALFGGWRRAFLYVGAVVVVASFLWIFFGRSVPAGTKQGVPSPVVGVKRGMKSRNIWLLALAHFLLFGAFSSLSGNLPEALEKMRHISPQEAGGITSLITLAAIGGNLVIPTISDKVGLRKPFIYGGAAFSGICFFLTWLVAPGADSWALASIGGFIFGGVGPILFAIPLELPEIGHEYVGGTSGFVISLGNMGGFLIPLLIISPLMALRSENAYTLGFAVVAFLMLAMVLPTIFLKETGAKANTTRTFNKG